MSTGQSLLVFTPLANAPPTTTPAAFDTRGDHPVLTFDPSTAQDALFGAVLPRNYSGGGITVTLVWAAATATSGAVVWAVAWERLQDGVDTLASSSFAAAAQGTAATAPGTSGIVKYTEIACTNGAQIDSLAAGEAFRLKVTRVAADAGDTMTGLAQLIRVELRET